MKGEGKARVKNERPRFLKRSLVFDFDGTIADTLDRGLEIYNELAAEHGFLPVDPDDIVELRDMDTSEILRRLQIPPRRVPLLLATALRRLHGNITRLALIEGMTEAITALHRQRRLLGILSSNTPGNVNAFLQSHGLRDHFTFIHSLGKLGGKSRGLQKIMKKHSLAPEELLYVGDELRDLRAARRANVAAVAVTWGLNSRTSLAQANPAYLLDHPGELLQLP